MRIDYAKLEAAGFRVEQDGARGVDINYILPEGSGKLTEILQSYASTPMGKDLIIGTVFDAIAKAKFIELIG